MTTELAVTTADANTGGAPPNRGGGNVAGAGMTPGRGPGRPLGLRAEPTLRLAIGYRDDEKRGAPVKLDHFLAKQGPDGAHAPAARKFHQVYGPEPKAIDVRLPSELGQALVVRHMAWAGTGGDEGGSLRAIGRTNFATLGVMGGPDVLTVWRPDGQVDEIDISGVDDPAAVELGVELYTTFRFHLPRVLGLGAMAEITSKGQKTTDNLYARLFELYALLESRVSFAVEPKLVVRRSSARPMVVDKRTGETRRIKSTIYVLDLVIPESVDEMFNRLAQRQQVLYGGREPVAALYGGASTVDMAGAVAPPAYPDRPRANGDGEASPSSDSGGADPSPAIDEDDEPDDGEWEPVEGDPQEPVQGDPLDNLKSAHAAGLYELTFGKKKGQTVSQIGDDDPGYVHWMATTMQPTSASAREAQTAARAYLLLLPAGDGA